MLVPGCAWEASWDHGPHEAHRTSRGPLPRGPRPGLQERRGDGRPGGEPRGRWHGWHRGGERRRRGHRRVPGPCTVSGELSGGRHAAGRTLPGRGRGVRGFRRMRLWHAGGVRGRVLVDFRARSRAPRVRVRRALHRSLS
ncbi:hypothetical protein E8A74_14550 [Polyangium fumosum]|uniref:Uncharacterized protein n=1 Tax=Polyangium fumosum TaxID=889272 RepID=A0A4U1JCV5_9BACT|nr:hypothetical protein E8A74_14550 [Polyangium fumosum]